MNIGLQKSFYHLIGKTNLNDATTGELSDFTNTYPYFAPAHFFLSYKQQQTGNDAFVNQLKKTNLLFNNPFWLHYQLNEQPQHIEFLNKTAVAETDFKPLLQKVVQEEIQQQIHIVKEEEPVEEVIDNIITEKPEIIEEKAAIEIPTIEKVHKMMENFTDSNKEENKVETKEDEATVESEFSITSFALEAAEETFEPKKDEEPIIEEQVETSKEEAIIDTLEKEQPKQATTIAEEITQEAFSQTEAEQIEQEVEPEKAQELTEEIIDNIIIEEPENNHLNNVLEEQLKQFQQPVKDDDVLDIDVTPFHTVDYFASQGIKAEESQAKNDKLTSQLKTFTDWLKQMKKVSLDNQDDLGTDPELENAIQGIAQNSNEAKEIVTETMAEVLEKQGKKDKAIQLYIKLSFLNPDKSAYFAAKIQQLKGI